MIVWFSRLLCLCTPPHKKNVCSNDGGTHIKNISPAIMGKKYQYNDFSDGVVVKHDF